MSRTYKDLPLRIREHRKIDKSKYEEEVHFCGARLKANGIRKIKERTFMEDYTFKVVFYNWVTYYQPCNIDEVPLPGKKTYPWCYRKHMKHVWDRWSKDGRKYYNSQIRGENLRKTRKAIREYNTYGEIEDDPIFTPLPRNSIFGGGYLN